MIGMESSLSLQCNKSVSRLDMFQLYLGINRIGRHILLSKEELNTAATSQRVSSWGVIVRTTMNTARYAVNAAIARYITFYDQ